MKFPCIRFLSISLGVFFAFVYTAQAATYTVTNLNNSGSGSLRDAVAAANSTGEDDTVVFAANLGCANNACEIVLSDEIVINPVIGGRLRIDNTTSQAITLNANNASRIFYVNGGFEINRLTLIGGTGFGSYDDTSKTYGGAVFVNNGEFVMTNSAVRNSSTQLNADSRGGAIYLKAGAALIRDSELTGNAAVQGGGVYIQGGTMTLDRALIANNRAQRTDSGSYSGGGGVYTAGGTLYALNTTITGNQALGNVTLTGIYGAMYIGQGTNAVYLTNCSVVYNSAARNTPGIFIPYADILRMRNTVVFGNAQTNGAVVDVLGEGFTSGGKNVFGVVQVNFGVGATDVQFATETQVGIGRTLGNNGGATRTLPLAANSILIENGNNCARAFCSDYPEPLTVAVDARGVSRYSNGQNLDTGAIERYSTTFFTTTLSNGTVRDSYSQTLTATTTGPFPITYSTISGGLPPGLTLSSGGVLSGVPTQAGSFTFTVKAETTANPDEGQVTQIFQLQIDPAQPLTVSNTNNSGAGSLRERLAQAAFTGSGTINFDFAPDDPNCSNGVCRVNLTDQLTVNYSYPVTIDGAGANRIVISGNNQSRVFYNSPGANLTLKKLIVRDGNGTSLSHPAENGDGGGMVNRGTLRLENVWVMNNASSLYNGAIANHGNLTIVNSTVSGNNAGYNSIYGTTGGVGSDGQLFIVNSTISGNRSHNNIAGGAGGIFNNNGDVYLVNTTVTDNQANATARSDSAAGVRHVGTFGFFRLRNSIVAANRDNATAPDTIGVFISSGNNLIGNRGASNFNQPSDQTGTGASLRNPLLAPLGNYGGQIPLHALLNNSTARDAGNNCVLNAACDNLQLATDQRGSLAPRKTGAAVDIGAFESNISFSTSATGNGGQGTLPTAQGAQNYSVIFTASRLNNLAEFASSDNSEAVNSAPFSYSIASGSLPFGLSLNQNTGELSGAPMQGGNFTFTILATDADGIAGAQRYNLTVIAPTAASVTIGGRVLSPEGKGLRNALVRITGVNGESRTATTSAFGYYRFADVPAGQNFVLQVISKRYQFAPRTVNVTEETNELNFVGQY